ncbi:MAG TPA: sodium:glucose symporter [Candidatus Hydrogenedentes bacterium]|nr:sodium:glucose symporter [Candidatus Hydrogenedentota bacterium]
MTISSVDLIIIVIYMAGILFVGLWSVRKIKHQTSESYFLANRSLRWPVVGAALFASNISTIHLVGLAESGFGIGMVVGNFEWMATFTLMLLTLIFVPIYFRTRITTLPEFMEKRYSPTARTVLAVMFIMSAMLIHIGISLYAGAAVFEQFFGIPPWASIAAISSITAIYTVVGGLRAVVVTETIQTAILLTGAVIITVIAFTKLPDAGIHSYSDLVDATKPNQLSMIHTPGEEGYDRESVWYGFLLGFPILGLWYWCTDQTIVQRVLGAKTLRDAQHGALFAGLLKVLPPFFMVLPGVLAYVLFKDIIAEPKDALPTLITELLPVGLVGIMAAALLAALMSTIAAALNSTGTLVAVDIAKHVRPDMSEDMQVRIGRISSVIVMILAIAWSTQGDKFGSIFQAINKMPAQFIAPPIATVLVWGVFWRRGTSQAGTFTLLFGFLAGLVIFMFDMGFEFLGGVQYVSDPENGLGIPFMMQAFYYFSILSVVYVGISLATPPPSNEQVEGVTWESPLAFLKHAEVTGIFDPRLLAALLLSFLGLMYFLIR